MIIILIFFTNTLYTQRACVTIYDKVRYLSFLTAQHISANVLYAGQHLEALSLN